jgi:hypothetical protein
VVHVKAHPSDDVDGRDTDNPGLHCRSCATLRQVLGTMHVVPSEEKIGAWPQSPRGWETGPTPAGHHHHRQAGAATNSGRYIYIPPRRYAALKGLVARTPLR